jgi:hypothetical protein
LPNWRRKALALFPELRPEVQRPGFTIYMLFFDLLPMAPEAHEAGDEERLRRIYGFAEWCFEQKAKDMWNTAAANLVRDFTAYLVGEAPDVRAGQTFRAAPEEPVFRLKREPCTRYSDDDLFHNPHGYWRLLPLR